MNITNSALQVRSAEQRGYDRAHTIWKSGEFLNINPAEIAGQLYPDDTELQNACAKGMQAGWNDAVADGPVFADPVDLLAPPDPVVFLHVLDPFPCLRCDVKPSVKGTIFCTDCKSLVDAVPAEPIERQADQ